MVTGSKVAEILVEASRDDPDTWTWVLIVRGERHSGGAEFTEVAAYRAAQRVFERWVEENF